MLKLFDFVCKKCGKEFELLFDEGKETPKCECGSEDVEKSFLNFRVNYKLLYDPKKDICSWGHENYATSQYWRACNEAKDRGEKVMPITELTGDSSVFRKD